ncbi:MAG: nucleotidyltransferase [Elusimicrobia bacterium]|nr:nucleotidyltransferase [Elusimicrobiota bacterium]
MTSLEKGLCTITAFLDEGRAPYMVIGGIANLVWGVPRTTLDIDLTVWAPGETQAPLVEALARAFKSLPEDPAGFALDTRVLPLEVEGFRVDIIFGQLPYEERAIRRARPVDMGGFSVRVCSPEDLIVHKVLSERPKDLEDVRGIVRNQAASLDRAYLDPLVRGLAEDLSRPSIWEFYLSCWEGRDISARPA